MIRVICLLVFFCLSHVISAQTDSASSGSSTGSTVIVKGLVIDEKNNTPMTGVNVTVRGSTIGTTTDKNGNYELTIPTGEIHLKFSYLGYQDRGMDVLAIKTGSVHTINAKMTELAKELDIVVVSGSKSEKKLGEQTQSMEVLKGENITSSAQGIAEAVNKVPGVNMVGKTISIRGGSGFSDVTSNRTLVLLDDIPMVSPENGSVRWETMPTEAIEQMEIVKGSATVTNGAQALNALINVRTLNAQKDEPFNKVYVNYGAYMPFTDPSWTWFWKRSGGMKISPMYGGVAYVHARKYGDVDVMYNGAYQQNQGYTQLNRNQNVRSFIKFRYIPHAKPYLNIGGNMNVSYQKYDDFFRYRNYNDTFQPNPTRDSLVLVPYQPTLQKILAFNINPYVTYYDKKENRHSIKASYYVVLSDNTSGDSSLSHKAYLEYLFTRKFKKADADLAAGIRTSYKRIFSHTFGNKNSEYAAAYIQIEKRFDKRFNIKIGMSAEYNKLDTVAAKNDLSFVNAMAVKDSTNRITAPVKPIFNLGLNYQLGKGTFLRASFAQGYRFPDIAEQFVLTPRSGALTIPNGNLKPESSWNAEVGIKQGVKFSRWVFYGDLAAYLSRYTNLIEFTAIRRTQIPASISSIYNLNNFTIYEQAQNITNAQIWGIEISAIGTGKIFGVPLNFLVGYNYMNPRNLNPDPKDPTSRYLNYRMAHSAKADAQTTYKNFIMGVTCVYIGHMEKIDKLIGALTSIKDWYNNHGTNGDVILDARLGYTFKHNFTATIIAKNITDRAYVLRPGFIEAPASITLQLTYKWSKIIG